ncbi:MAG: haloacid dehalogenase-like hydrolase [Deltaproteobacteria bacterium]|nr:haloacid dehalogenase-like hydrolase [Deltaproteobacteria bacterium]
MTQPPRPFGFPVTHAAQDVVRDTLERVAATRAAGRVPVVLFDLDGTLFDNAPRTWQILYEFSVLRARHELTARLRTLPKHQLPYALADILALVDEHDGELLRQVAAFWEDRFFRDDYIRYDEPVRGALQFVRMLYDAGTTVVYFSGRDSPGMLVGTAQSLRTHGFPVGVPRAVMALKESFDVEDLVFKRRAVEFMDTLGEVVASFDNEPGNCNMFRQAWPRAAIVAVATSHAPNPHPLHPSVAVIRDFVD